MKPAQVQEKAVYSNVPVGVSLPVMRCLSVEQITTWSAAEPAPISSSNRKGRLHAELTVPIQWSYQENGQKNAGGREPPGRDPGSRAGWNTP